MAVGTAVGGGCNATLSPPRPALLVLLVGAPKNDAAADQRLQDAIKKHGQAAVNKKIPCSLVRTICARSPFQVTGGCYVLFGYRIGYVSAVTNVIMTVVLAAAVFWFSGTFGISL